MTNYEKLRAKLTEMFMLDRADLDFGIYRIMNSKRDEILRFLDNDLLPQVREVLEAAQGEIGASGADELKKLETQILSAGMNPDDSPKVQELRAKYSAGGDLTALEQEVFNHLYSFFRRYYDEGDFLSLRRYKEGVYAIPYEGEEVKLHWANADQYYIKTAEHFRDYTFKVGPEKEARRVHFKLVDAETEKDNNKASEKRVFILRAEDPISEVDGELIIRFEYRAAPDRRKQKEHSEEAIARILAEAPADWQSLLHAKAPTEKNPNRTVLEKHLTDYTARNTFDYFIHKDLGGFLRRELDFYIKNEVMHLDDIENEAAPKVEQYLAKVRAIRRVAGKLIDFLAQLEDFQRRLWLKKKFVVDTQYLVSVGILSDELLRLVCSNEGQLEEWKTLYRIDSIQATLSHPAYTFPLALQFLREHPTLVVDTRHFDSAFKDELLKTFADIEDQLLGTAVQSHNLQFLRLARSRYAGKVRTVYVDPPFNTGSDFAYKDGFQTSSWLSLMQASVDAGQSMLTSDGHFFLHLDDNGQSLGKVLLSDYFQDITEISFNTNATKDDESGLFSYKSFGQRFVRQHDTIFHCMRDSASFIKLWKPNRRTSSLDLGQLDLLGIPVHQPARSMEDFTYNVEKWEAGNLVLNQIATGDEKLFPVGDIWYDLYSFTQSEMRVSENVSFATQKPEHLIRRVIQSSSRKGDMVLDYFAGSGTTAAVSIKLDRKFLCVEMGDHFDTIYRVESNNEEESERLGLLGRLKIVMRGDASYSLFGKPRRAMLSRQIGWVGCEGIAKYIRLESYEETLANLTLQEGGSSQLALALDNQQVREDYAIRYQLDSETAGSSSLINVQNFAHPFCYTLNVFTSSVGQTHPAQIDLIETFNWLLGLRVHTMDVIRGFRVVTGRLPGPGNSDNGDKALIIWRDLDENPNEKLDEFFAIQNYNTRDQEFDVIYVNGDNNLQNLRKDDQTWKVRLIEEEFHRLMWDVEDV